MFIMKRLPFILTLAFAFLFASCDKDDSENENKDPQPTKIVNVDQAESVARNLWQLISNINDNIDDGYEYTRVTIDAPNLGEFVITGVKYTDQDNCTITSLSECVLNNVEYSGYTFNGSFQYLEKNFHYNSNYKRKATVALLPTRFTVCCWRMSADDAPILIMYCPASTDHCPLS